ncbi:unnamed protein product [Symbiodinium natans]|uniref:Uncharacterized protein n=1 Tax=Symbiodinium natans TaxID=878477 RepID=A0A812MJB8_9DINO|nr:unnamed protein product [Symbiodinium natans]
MPYGQPATFETNSRQPWIVLDMVLSLCSVGSLAGRTLICPCVKLSSGNARSLRQCDVLAYDECDNAATLSDAVMQCVPAIQGVLARPKNWTILCKHPVCPEFSLMHCGPVCFEVGDSGCLSLGWKGSHERKGKSALGTLESTIKPKSSESRNSQPVANLSP